MEGGDGVSLPDLIQAMLRPEMYAHRPTAVTLVQTHISYVFLAGEEVYKVKKPVRFSFLDFSTPERRHHFCRQEVDLNRRLAAAVYLGVVAICEDRGHYWLGAEDDRHAVDYAVRMRRLPSERTLDQLLARGEATPAMLDRVAQRLADFHRQADSGPAVTANGDPTAIAAVLEDNFDGMRSFRQDTIPADDDDAIQTFSRSFLRCHAGLFRQRQAQHRIRDCHGDLHSEHICLDGEPIIFDCIEFNARYRYCDTASEIAFLVMDLDYHARRDLSGQLLRAYASYAQDPELPALVPFYACYRAYVRGKVDSFTSAEEEVEAVERQRARANAQRHFALAYRYTWAYSPCVVLTAGLSGTGKSALASTLAARTDFVHLRSDVIRKALAGMPPETRVTTSYNSGLYAPVHTVRTYAAMLQQAAEHVAAGRGVILDATFQRQADRQAARAIARQHSVPYLLVECHCEEEEVRRRLGKRRTGVSDADWNVYVEQRSRFEPVTPEETSDRLPLETTGALAELSRTVERALRARSGEPRLQR